MSKFITVDKKLFGDDKVSVNIYLDYLHKIKKSIYHLCYSLYDDDELKLIYNSSKLETLPVIMDSKNLYSVNDLFDPSFNKSFSKTLESSKYYHNINHLNYENIFSKVYNSYVDLIYTSQFSLYSLYKNHVLKENCAFDLIKYPKIDKFRLNKPFSDKIFL